MSCFHLRLLFSSNFKRKRNETQTNRVICRENETETQRLVNNKQMKTKHVCNGAIERSANLGAASSIIIEIG